MIGFITVESAINVFSCIVPMYSNPWACGFLLVSISSYFLYRFMAGLTINWGKWAAVPLLGVIVALLVLFYNSTDINNPTTRGYLKTAKNFAAQGLHKEASSQVSANAPVINQGASLPTPPHSVTILGPDKWKVTVPADEEFHTGITVSQGQRITFSDWAGQVKLDPMESFTNTTRGAYPTDKVKPKFPEAWFNPESWTGALLARLGTDNSTYLDVGGRGDSSFEAKEDGEILLSINCLVNERMHASGAYEVTIEVQ
jgi:hypothetical protein